MERVVLGYDGSPASEAALEWAAHRARSPRSEIEVVLVTNMFLSERPEADRILDAAARRWRALVPGTPADVTRLTGLMPAALTRAARGADLLVLGVHPGFRTRTMLTGWVPLRVAARSRIPTALVPAGWSASDAPVTVGVDDDDSSTAALLFAAQAASSSGVPLRVVHSWLMASAEPRWSDELPLSPRDVAAAHERVLHAAVERVREVQPDVVASAELVRDNPTSALTRVAERSSLLVIGTHGRSVVAGAFLGSVGMDLIGTLRCPICVVPSPSATASRPSVGAGGRGPDLYPGRRGPGIRNRHVRRRAVCPNGSARFIAIRGRGNPPTAPRRWGTRPSRECPGRRSRGTRRRALLRGGCR